MCGRFTLVAPGPVLAEEFGAPPPEELSPRYNIAPSQPVLAVRLSVRTGSREFALLRWGLIPSWAQDPAIGHRMINARAETVAEKPSFRGPFRHRRCLVPASGFYEWKVEGEGKRPFYIRRRDGRPLAIAGLWDSWKSPEGPPVESVTLITTGANDTLAPIHDRMPVILPPEAFGVWLDGGSFDSERLLSLLRPFPAGKMEAHPVSPAVNDPRHDSPSNIE